MIDFRDRQLDIMNILWNQGSATVRETKEELEDDLAYTSVLTVFQTLEKNGKVGYEQEGKAYRYHPSIGREEAGREAARYVLHRYFAGSRETMLETLADVSDAALGDLFTAGQTSSRDGAEREEPERVFA